MKSRRRLFYYLLINIFVSALVAGAVIFYYDHFHRVVCYPALPNVATAIPDSGNINVNILGIIGTGTLQDEQMIIQNDGTGELGLTGWILTDNKGNLYTFPQLTLHPGVKVQLHTMAGKDSPTDLYWGRPAPVWSSGELAILYDAHGIARAFYRVP
ncbi:MAG: lamin tail domain-containing protein [Anaerolineales bacterium]